MKRFTTILTLIAIVLIAAVPALAQLSGTKSIPSVDYPTIKAAIDSINLYGVGGALTFNVAAGHTETGFGMFIWDSTTNSTNTITFQKSGAGANPLITAGVGVGTGDAIIGVAGSDYVTFDGIDLLESAGNVDATTQMEYGYALLNSSADNGPQYCVIKNCTVTLSRANTTSTAFYKSNGVPAAPSTGLTPTTLNGTGSYNKVYSNTVADGFHGVRFFGYTTTLALFDQGNEIGLSGANNLTYSGGAATSYGVYGTGQNDYKVYNNVFNTNPAHTSTLRAVYIATGNIGGNVDIIGNTITLANAGTSTSAVAGIEVNSAAGTTNIRSNTINGCTYPSPSSGTFRGIYYNASGATALNIDSNNVTNNSLGGTGALEAITVNNLVAGTPVNIRGNYVAGNLKTGTASGSFYGSRIGTGNILWAGNQILNNGTNNSNSSTFYGYYNNGSPTVEDYYNNTIKGLFISSGTGTMYGIYRNTTSSSVTNIYNNLIDSLFNGGSTLTGIFHGFGGLTTHIYKNTIRNLQSSGASASVSGINIATGTTVHIYNNYISDLRATTSTGTTVAVAGINISSTSGTDNVYYNTIYLNATSASASTFGTSGIFANTGTTVDLRNNVVVNLSTPGPTGGSTVAYRRSSTTLTTFAAASNNNDFYVDPGAGVRRYHYSQGLTTPADNDSTIAAYKARVAPRCSNAFAENPPFIDVSATPYNLHINTSPATQTESGGTPVTSPIAVSDDFDGHARHASTPDVGADEFIGIALDLTSPSIVYTALANTGSTSARTLTASITDALSGVPTAGIGLPVLYWKINSGSYSSATGTFVSGSSYDFTFGAGVALNDTVRYYIVAQDGATTPNVGSFPSAGAGGFTANPPAAATPPTTPSSYIITPVALSGDYTVGAPLFNRVSGKNITFERVVKRVVKEVPEMVPVTDTKGATASPEALLRPTGKMLRTEVEEISWVPMQNGKVYNGDLFVKRSENPNLSPEAGTGVYATITAAVADLNLRGVSGATRFLLLDATYPTETLPIAVNVTNASVPTAVNTVTFRPATGVTTALTGTSATSIMQISGTDYVTLDGAMDGSTTTKDWTITNTSTSTSSGVLQVSSGADGAQNITLKNLNVRGNDPTQTIVAIAMGGAGIGTAGTDNDNNRIQNCSVQKAVYGIYSAGASLANQNSGTVITQNDLSATGVDRIRRVGIVIFNDNGAQVSYNTVGGIDNTGEGADAIGIGIGTQTVSSSQVTSLGVTNATVNNNKVNGISQDATFSASGIAVAGSAGGANTISNNMVSGVIADANAGDIVAGIFVAGVPGSDTRLYYNSVFMTGDRSALLTPGTGQYPSFGIGITGTDPTVDVRDNAVETDQTAEIGANPAAKSYGIGTASTTFVNMNSNYNDFWSTGPQDGGFRSASLGTTGGTDYVDIAAWRTATGDDLNSIEENAPFISATDLHIDTSVLTGLDAGATPIAGITIDYDGNTRNATTPDIGADEFTYVPPVLPPNPAVNVSPADLATNVPVAATLNWASGGGGPTGYKLSFGTDNPPTNILLNSDLGLVTTYDPSPNMTYSTVYYWKVVAYNTSGDATGSAIWSFTTEADPTITSFPYTEDFTSGTFPPAGWSRTGTVIWSRQTTPVQPDGVVGPALKADFYNVDTGRDTLVTPPFNMGALGSARLKFHHAYRTFSTAEQDSLDILASTDNGATWSIVLYHDGDPNMSTLLPSTSAYTPAAAGDWRLNTITLPGALLANGVKFAFIAKTEFGNNLWIDNIVVEEPPANVAPAVAYNIISSSTNGTGIVLTATITDNVSVDSTAGGAPRFWYRSGSTIPLTGPYTDISGARTAPGADTWAFTVPTLSSGTFVEYYVAAQDNGSPKLIVSEPAGTGYTSDPPNGTVAAPNRFVIKSPLTFTVGASGADFPSMTEGMSWFGGIDGSLQLLLNSDYTSAGETFPISIVGSPTLAAKSARSPLTRAEKQARAMVTTADEARRMVLHGEDASVLEKAIELRKQNKLWPMKRINGLGETRVENGVTLINTLTIMPNGAATPGPISGAAGSIFNIWLANNVTLDGLTIVNATTGIGLSAVLDIEDANNITIKNCTIKGGLGAFDVYASPDFGTTSSNITFDNCDITSTTPGASGFGWGIFMTGGGTSSTNNWIKNCRVYDFGPTGGAGTGIFISVNTVGTLVENTDVYMTTPGGSLAGSAIVGMNFGSGASGPLTGVVVRNNTVRDLNSSVAVASIRGIVVASTTPVVGALVEGNTVRNIGFTTPASSTVSATRGIQGQLVSGLVISKNIVKDLSNSASNPVLGIYFSGSGSASIINNFVNLGNVGGSDNSYRGIFSNGLATDVLNVAFNSVYIGGIAGAAGTNDGYLRNPASADTLRNNVFHNQRSGGIANYAIRSVATTGAFSSNYNVLYADGALGVLGNWGGADQATLALWQAATAGDANSVNADPMYVDPITTENLHITNAASPASNAGTPVAGVTDDIDGNLRNATTPDIGADEFASSTTIGVSVATNWNIISLPVTGPTPDDSVQHVFTNSINPYAFAFVGGYVQRYTLANGPGYWIKSSTTYTQNITGAARDTLTVPVASAWNMVGSISTSIDTSEAHVTPSVPGLRASNFFKYNNGYVVATTIEPGLGYWVKASSAGSFFMHATGPAKASEVIGASARSIEDLNTITIRDANGGSQTLYFGADANSEIPVNMFVMPPAPPVGSFDARFESVDGGTMAQTHPEEVSEVVTMPIAIQSSAYPLTLSWKVKGTASYELSDGVGGVHPVRGEGTLKITNSSVGQVMLKLTGTGGLPKEFALDQNYPNPFNPTTNIKYALPVDSRLTVEIYNIIGQRVRTLVNSDQAAGFHIVEWNGTGNAGQQLASGVYFLRMSAIGVNGKTFSDIRKLMMMK